MPQHSSEPDRFVSLHRFAQLTGRNRATLLIRVKDGRLLPDAWLEVGPGRLLPLFLASSAVSLRKTPRSSHPLL
jgi:hypothetical protein